MKPKIVIFAAVVVVTIVGVCWDMIVPPRVYEATTAAEIPAALRHPDTWPPLPDVTFERLDGTKLDLKDLQGKVVLLNFWATWCPTCIKDFPGMLAAAEKFQGELVIVALSNDDDKAALEKFYQVYEKTYQQKFESPHLIICWDKDRKITSGVFDTVRFPETILIAKNSKMAEKLIGEVDWESRDVTTLLQNLISMD